MFCIVFCEYNRSVYYILCVQCVLYSILYAYCVMRTVYFVHRLFCVTVLCVLYSVFTVCSVLYLCVQCVQLCIVGVQCVLYCVFTVSDNTHGIYLPCKLLSGYRREYTIIAETQTCAVYCVLCMYSPLLIPLLFSLLVHHTALFLPLPWY